MSAVNAIQVAIFTKLRADGPLGALLPASVIDGDAGKAIYDQPPQPSAPESSTGFPFVVLGDDTATEWDTDSSFGQETTITLHVFSRATARKECKQIQDAIYNALQDASLAVTGHTAVLCFFEFSESFADPDGATQHGVSRFRILTEKN